MSEHHTTPPKNPALRAKALQTLMVEKGLIEDGVVDTIIDIFSNKLGPRGGARLVARAWTDSDFKQRLLDRGEEAAKELGLSGLQTEMLHVVENTDDVHNAVVCTLCSCYPWAVLGLAPAWYKSTAYRSRIVLEPRKTLAEFGLAVDPRKEIRIWDSNSEIRYMVLPQRPAGTDSLTEAELADLVSRDAMIGTALATAPATGGQQ